MSYYVDIPLILFSGAETSVQMDQDDEDFDCSSGSIVGIDLSPLAKVRDLRVVNLSGNRIQTIDLSPVAGFSYLQKLDLSSNEMESVDLTPLGMCLRLETLSLAFNHLLELDLSPLSTCRSLKKISLSNNFLKEVDLTSLEHCSRLERIELSINDLTFLDLSPVIMSPRLKSLRCDSHLEIRVNPVHWDMRVVRDEVTEKTKARFIDFGILFKPAPATHDLEPDRRTMKEILGGGEGQITEFKSSFRLDLKSSALSDSLKHEVIRTVCGFMNSQGGVLLIGVQDNIKIIGIRKELKRVRGKNPDGYELTLRQAVETAIGRKNEALLQIQFEPWGDQEICRVDVTKSVAGPVFLKPRKGDPEFWVRLGNSTKKLTGAEMIAFIGENWPETFIQPAESKNTSSGSPHNR